MAGLDFCHILDKTMWYISFLFFWYAAFYLGGLLVTLCHAVTKREGLFFVEVLWLFAAAAVCLELERRGAWGGAGANVYALTFPLGALLFWLGQRRVSPRMKTALWSAVLLACVITSLCLYQKPMDTAFIYTLFGLVWMGVFVAASQLPLPQRKQTVLMFFGRYSYSIYLFESFFLIFRNA